jgi:hypothetical protein
MIIVKYQRSFSIALLVASMFVGYRVAAQSSDQGLPTPVLTKEINATIVPLDMGDSRLTRHYYAFEGEPGDLLITLNTRNLNGDVDVFTAITFRPLMKISLFANTIPPEVTKSIYLRTKQILILRIEARSPNDDAGVYHITFGGSFAPFSGGIQVAETSEPPSDSGRTTGRNTKRLSSVGARIDEPVAEASPSPEPSPVESKKVEEKSAEETAAATKPAPKPRSTRSTPRNTRVRPPRTPRTKPAETEATKTTPAETSEAPKTAEEKPASSDPAASEATVPQPGAHLIIEAKDGTKIDRPMATVRRVVVEGGTIVIVLKTGKIERVPMASVLRMSIEPQ